MGMRGTWGRLMWFSVDVNDSTMCCGRDGWLVAFTCLSVFMSCLLVPLSCFSFISVISVHASQTAKPQRPQLGACWLAWLSEFLIRVCKCDVRTKQRTRRLMSNDLPSISKTHHQQIMRRKRRSAAKPRHINFR